MEIGRFGNQHIFIYIYIYIYIYIDIHINTYIYIYVALSNCFCHQDFFPLTLAWGRHTFASCASNQHLGPYFQSQLSGIRGSDPCHRPLGLPGKEGRRRTNKRSYLQLKINYL
jgi:hypothetical protein